MLADLSHDERLLADYMSELSELAFCAGWEGGLEFALGDAMQGQRSKYGMLVLTDTHRQKLKLLSEQVQGWIIFDDQREETFLPLEDWKSHYAERKGEQGGCTSAL